MLTLTYIGKTNNSTKASIDVHSWSSSREQLQSIIDSYYTQMLLVNMQQLHVNLADRSNTSHPINRFSYDEAIWVVIAVPLNFEECF